MLTAILIALASAPPATSTAERDGEVKVFKDWVVGCDNMRSCHAVSLYSEGDGQEEPVGDGYLEVSIKRSGGPLDSPRIRFVIKEDAGDIIAKIGGLAVDEDRKIIMKLRGADLETEMGGKQAALLLAAIGDRRTLNLVDEKGEPIASASLRGLKAALRFIDAQQYRVGTVSALVAKGTKPASSLSIPPMLPLPAVRVAALPSMPPVTLDEAALAPLRKLDPCLQYSNEALPNSTTKFDRLDAANTLLILPTTCGGYNPASLIFVIDEKGAARLAPFARFEGAMIDENGTMVDPTWDEGARILSTFGRGRGLADCGQVQDFAWDGSRFITVFASTMPECRGSWDYITTYRRDVVIEQ
jgi:Protein of unknown function (DUF1176)